MATLEELKQAYIAATGTYPSRLDGLSDANVTDQDIANVQNAFGTGGGTTTRTSTSTTSTSTSTATVTPEMVLGWFATSGADPSLHGDGSYEDPNARAQRIANEINSGSRTEAEVRSAIDRLSSTSSGGTSAATGGQVTPQEVLGWFEELGLDPSLHADGSYEDPDARAQRIANEINSGLRSEADVRAAIQNIYTGGGGTLAGKVTPEMVLGWFEEAGKDPSRHSDGSYEDPWARAVRIANEINSGIRTVDQVRNAIANITPPIPQEAFTILGGDVRWYEDPRTGKFYAAYKIPGSEMYIVFEADETQLDALFGEGTRPNAQVSTFDQLVGREDVFFGGNIAEMQGEGLFEDEFRKMLTIALENGSLPDWAKGDREAEALLFIYITEGKTPEWLATQLSNTQAFQRRFPGIEALTSLDMTIPDAVSAYLEYERSVKQLQMSYGQSPDAITPEIIGKLLEGAFSFTDVQNAYKVFDRANKYAPALAAFNEVLVANGYDPLDEQGIFDFIGGFAPKELYDLYEASTIQEAATRAGISPNLFGGQEALELAVGTEGLVSANAAFQQFSQAAQQLLQFRAELGVEKYGLSQDDIIDLALGQPPSSGKTLPEVAQIMQRIHAEAGGFLATRIQSFKGFTQEGVIQSRSLARARTRA